jgi:hypothetical protein
MGPIGVGVPGWPHPATSWDWWVFAGVAVVLVLARLTLRLRLGSVCIVVAVAFGPLYAALVHRWGVVSIAALTLAVRIALAPFRGHRPPISP